MTNQNKTVSIDLDRLKSMFKSKSVYIAVWNEVKRYDIATLDITDISKLFTIRNAITKLKQLDYYFKVANEFEDKKLELVFEYNEVTSSLVIKLSDIKNIDSPINFK